MIRTFFDLISSRGMLFVTYVSDRRQVSPKCSLCPQASRKFPQYDLRAAQAARDRLQGMEVNNRPVSKLHSGHNVPLLTSVLHKD